jgi:hypothetical protein
MPPRVTGRSIGDNPRAADQNSRRADARIDRGAKIISEGRAVDVIPRMSGSAADLLKASGPSKPGERRCSALAHSRPHRRVPTSVVMHLEDVINERFEFLARWKRTKELRLIK